LIFQTLASDFERSDFERSAFERQCLLCVCAG